MKLGTETFQMIWTTATVLGVLGVFGYFLKGSVVISRLSIALLSLGILGNLAGFASGALPFQAGWAALTLAFGVVPLLVVWGGLSLNTIDPHEAALIERIMRELEDDIDR